MQAKPTYEELALRVEELEKSAAEQKEEFETLRRSEAVYRRLVENSPAVVFQFRMDREGRFSFPYISSKITELFKVNVTDGMRDPSILLDMVPRQDLDVFQAKVMQSAASMSKFSSELRVMVDGMTQWVNVQAIPKGQPDGSILWDGFCSIITELKKAEANLRESEENLRTILNSIGDAVIATGNDGKIIRINPVAAKLTGWNMDEARGKPLTDIFEIVNAQTGAKVENPVQKVLEKGKIVGLANHTKLIARNGVQYQIADSAAPIKDQEGRIRGVVMVFRDVTEEYHKNQQIRESKELLKGIFHSIQDGISVLDPDLTIRYVNPVMERWYCHNAPLTGKKCYHCYHNSDSPCDPCPTLRCLETGKTEVEIVKGPPGNKSQVKWIELFSYPMTDPDSGKINGIVEFVRDITIQKQAQDKLLESETMFRSVFEASPDAISLSDLANGTYIDVNKSYTDIVGYSHEEVIGISALDLNIWKNPEDRQRLVKQLRQKGHIQNFEAKFSSKSGKAIDALLSASVAEINGRNVLIAITKDITEHKRLQQQLVQAQKMESIGTLAGGIAHNFNNILMGIQGRASLMMLGKDSSHPDYEHLKEIEEYVRNAVELTKALLGFARGGKYEVKPTDLNELIRNESRMFGRMKKEIKIHEKYAANLWPVEVDRGQIRQTLLNLFVNAWQAMPGGGDLYIQTENVEFDQAYIKPFSIAPGKYVKISLTDTGTGMDEATLEKIFDPFFSTKEVGQGFGLGLASVYGIVKNHGGFINVYSEKNKGTTFNIYLPASSKKPIADSLAPDQEKLHYGQGTILLVDDEELIIRVGQQMLEKLGYRVLVARNGQEAIEIYKKLKHQIDLVILDMIMPGMGGGKTFDGLKAIDSGVKVLLSSGYSLNGQAKDILNRGCLGFIQKPFSLADLARKLRQGIGPENK